MRPRTHRSPAEVFCRTESHGCAAPRGGPPCAPGSRASCRTTPSDLITAIGMPGPGEGLRIRWARRADIDEAFLKLAGCLITHRQLDSLCWSLLLTLNMCDVVMTERAEAGCR